MMSLKKLYLKTLTLIFLATLFISCEKKSNKNGSLPYLRNEDIYTKVDTKFLTNITTLNLKVISATNFTKEQVKLEKTKATINSIEQIHVLIHKKIKKIAEKNLIIIPDAIYLNKNSIDTLDLNRDYKYIIKLKKLLQEEIKEYSKAKTHTKNEEIKIFANETIIELQLKLNELNFLLNQLK